MDSVSESWTEDREKTWAETHRVKRRGGLLFLLLLWEAVWNGWGCDVGRRSWRGQRLGRRRRHIQLVTMFHRHDHMSRGLWTQKGGIFLLARYDEACAMCAMQRVKKSKRCAGSCQDNDGKRREGRKNEKCWPLLYFHPRYPCFLPACMALYACLYDGRQCLPTLQSPAPTCLASHTRTSGGFCFKQRVALENHQGVHVQVAEGVVCRH